ncbi:MAG TPA: YbaK/EbsC family protein [Anaerolineae bacterium]|nr:YbaK/EbsC family protein [Anaerolineae bacterium]
MDKTLVMKFLDGKKVSYEPTFFPDDMRDAELIATHLGVSPAALYKTLVVVRKTGKPMLVMIAAEQQLDLKKLAKSVGEKKLKMATHDEAEALTGLQVGGIAALALINKGFDIYLDERAKPLKQIYVSAGERGADVYLATKDLIKLTRARWVEAS